MGRQPHKFLTQNTCFYCSWKRALAILLPLIFYLVSCLQATCPPIPIPCIPPTPIRAGSKGYDSNLPASYHQGWQQGLWLKPASQLQEAVEGHWRECGWITSCAVWRYSGVDFNIRLIQLIVSVDSISCALSLWCWYFSFLFWTLPNWVYILVLFCTYGYWYWYWYWYKTQSVNLLWNWDFKGVFLYILRNNSHIAFALMRFWNFMLYGILQSQFLFSQTPL